jgi:ubiquinone biosynthesis protein Coq4
MGEPRNALQYSFKRAYKLHDLMHVALGCDASILGEVRIVSYSLGQGARNRAREGRAPSLALAVLLMHVALRRPTEFRDAIRLAYEWLQLGERSRPHVPFRLEDHLAERVAAVRELVLAPG